MGEVAPQANAGDGEEPLRRVHVPAFAIAATTVTNAQFTAFVTDTGYRTTAEELGWSFVFARLLTSSLRKSAQRPPHTPWWCAVPGANWAHPEGPGSGVAERGDHPVVHVSVPDALKYCAWAGVRLPSEAEWERAARGGLERCLYPWGDELLMGGKHRCNIWQGSFPVKNTLDDGFLATAPVRTFEPNGFGLYQSVGNVWEWCADPWAPATTAGTALDETGDRVRRGGSYLCHDSYCNRYRVAARTRGGALDTAGNVGFRTAAA